MEGGGREDAAAIVYHHEIGHVPAKLDANGDSEDPLWDIHWLPNGKQISFVYHDILYVVSADPGSGGGSEVRM